MELNENEVPLEAIPNIETTRLVPIASVEHLLQSLTLNPSWADPETKEQALSNVHANEPDASIVNVPEVSEYALVPHLMIAFLVDMRRLRAHYEKYDPTIAAFKEKYETVMKEKMLLKIDRDRLAAKLQSTAVDSSPRLPPPIVGTGTKWTMQWSPWPKPEDDIECEKVNTSNLHESSSFAAHTSAVSRLAMKDTLVATASDEGTVKLFDGHNREVSLVGHSAFVSGLSFHPTCPRLVSSSGDGHIKIWNLDTNLCESTLKDHASCVWSVAVHPQAGDWLLAASLDHTAKLIDLSHSKCKQTFRGHVDSVNMAIFIHNTFTIATASADKSVSLWDVRTAHCVHTIFGHLAAVNAVAVSHTSSPVLASVDAEGLVRLTDIRTHREIVSVSMGTGNSGNAVEWIDGATVAVACKDSLIRLIDTLSGNVTSTLSGHTLPVLGLAYGGHRLVSSDSSGTVKVWTS